MNFQANRRKLLTNLLAYLGLSQWDSFAWSQSAFPNQPIKVIIPFGPGGLADITIRLVALKLSERVGQQVIVENKPGAGGVIAAKNALAAPRDGHTLILFSNGTAIGKSLFKLEYDPESDFTPISSIAYFDLIMVTRKDGPISDIKTLLAQGKQRQLVFGSINPGSSQNLSAALFASVAKLNVNLIPYKSTPEVLTAVMRGDLDIGFESYAALKGAVDGGQVKVIAGTGPSRTPWLPHTPTVLEGGLSGYEVTGWNALYAAQGVPAQAIQILNSHLQEIMSMPDIKKRMLELGADPKASTPAELASVFRKDAIKWAQVIAQSNIKAQ